jgi:UDP-2,3-diacylglucosamine pyrophosphatase LpxH
MSRLQFRSIFVSDVHLGTRDCRADYLLDFLDSTQSQYLYLVGDIFDLWGMRRSVHWTAEHSAVVQRILDKAREGTRVIYVPGNHDEMCREFAGSDFQGVAVRLNATHTTADGRRFFVSHGDEFDGVVKHSPMLRQIGDRAYYALLFLNRCYNKIRRRFGRPYWSFSAYLKARVNNAVEYIRKYEQAAALEAERMRYDGYICGHIHKAGMRRIDGVLYCNDGDWVEHCTALVEDFEGNLQIVHWADHKHVEVATRGEQIDDSIVPLPVPSMGMSSIERSA